MERSYQPAQCKVWLCHSFTPCDLGNSRKVSKAQRGMHSPDGSQQSYASGTWLQISVWPRGQAAGQSLSAGLCSCQEAAAPGEPSAGQGRAGRAWAEGAREQAPQGTEKVRSSPGQQRTEQASNASGLPVQPSLSLSSWLRERSFAATEAAVRENARFAKGFPEKKIIVTKLSC